jgi:hypothetical protein
MRRSVRFLCEVGAELRHDILPQRHKAVASGQRRRLQSVDGFEFAVARSEPQREIVAAFVRERLQEEGAQRRTLADRRVGIGAIFAGDGDCVAAHGSLPIVWNTKRAGPLRGRPVAVHSGLFQRITFLFSSPPGAGARLPKTTPISGASSLNER